MTSNTLKKSPRAAGLKSFWFFFFRKRTRAPAALFLTLALLLSACSGSEAGVLLHKEGSAPNISSAAGPHAAAALTNSAEPLASSGWLELFLDEESKTVAIRGYEDAEWFTLPQAASTPLANAGACAVEAEIIVRGHPITLNSQDHSVAFGSAKTQQIEDPSGSVMGVQVEYLLTPDKATAQKKTLAPSDIAFLLSVRYTLRDGNFYVEAQWENASGNGDAFIASLGLMERFGALRNPGENDFLMLPDGGGALLYPARANEKSGFSDSADLRFAVYGEDAASPIADQNSSSLICRDEDGNVLAANVAAYGACYRNAAFAAVVEEGAALTNIIARQSIPGEEGIRQSAVGPRFTITPTMESGDKIYRAAESYGGPVRVCYRFFYGSSADFSTMAMSCREQLISGGVLSSTKQVRDSENLLPLNLTLRGTDAAGKTLTDFEQGMDIISRLKNKGVDYANIRYEGALGRSNANPEKVSPLIRLGGSGELQTLQSFCKAQNFSIFPDANPLPAKGSAAAKTLAGEPLKLRGADGIKRAVRAFIERLHSLGTEGISIGGLGGTLYADYAAGLDREETVQQLNACLPSLSAQWNVMLDTGYFHVVRNADVLVNLPLTPQLKPSAKSEAPRYVEVPLLAMILHGSVDYSGPAINLAQDSETAFLRSVAYGACPAYEVSATQQDEDDPLYFEARTDAAADHYIRANAALGDLRSERISSYEYDNDSMVSTTTFTNDAVIYVNFSNQEVTVSNIKIAARGFVRIGT